MSKKLLFGIGLLSGIALCGLLNWGINYSFQVVSMQAYNGLNSRVNDLEQRQSYVSGELQSEKGNREYSLQKAYSAISAIEDRLSDADIQAMRRILISLQSEVLNLKDELNRMRPQQSGEIIYRNSN